MKPLSADEILSNPLNQAIINDFYSSWLLGAFGNKTKALFLDMNDYTMWYITLPYEPQFHDIYIVELSGIASIDMAYEKHLSGYVINDVGFNRWYWVELYPGLEQALALARDRQLAP